MQYATLLTHPLRNSNITITEAHVYWHDSESDSRQFLPHCRTAFVLTYHHHLSNINIFTAYQYLSYDLLWKLAQTEQRKRCTTEVTVRVRQCLHVIVRLTDLFSPSQLLCRVSYLVRNFMIPAFFVPCFRTYLTQANLSYKSFTHQ